VTRRSSVAYRRRRTGAITRPTTTTRSTSPGSLAQSNTFGVGPINDNSSFNPGAMWFATAGEYVAAANAAEYLGFSTWRLPKVAPIDGVSFDYIPRNDGSSDRGYNVGAPGTAFAGSTASELAHLYYTTLGNVGYYAVTGAVTASDVLTILQSSVGLPVTLVCPLC
jgi:hypothetical protein